MTVPMLLYFAGVLVLVLICAMASYVIGGMD